MPFERMAYAIDMFAATTDEEVVVQTGWTDYAYKHVSKWFKMCTKEEMERYQAEASLLIMQGGWGSICESMEKGKRMVIIPRYDGTEHIHDQFQLIRKLDDIGAVIGVFPSEECPQKFREQYDETFSLLKAAVEKAKTFDFKKIVKGEAESLLRKKIEESGCGKRICLASSAGGHLRELQLAIGKIPATNFYLLYKGLFDTISKHHLRIMNVPTAEISAHEARDKLRTIQELEKEIAKLRKQMKLEPQFNRKMEYNSKLQKLKKTKAEIMGQGSKA